MKMTSEICSINLSGRLHEEFKKRVALGHRKSEIMREALRQYFGLTEEMRKGKPKEGGA